MKYSVTYGNEKKADVLTEKEIIVDMAASIIMDDIQTQVYNCSKYLFMDNTDDALSDVPDSLNRFIHGIIKSKDTRKMKSENDVHP